MCPSLLDSFRPVQLHKARDEHGLHPDGASSPVFVTTTVADKQGIARRNANLFERVFVNSRVGFTDTELVRKHGRIEAAFQRRALPAFNVVGTGVRYDGDPDIRRAKAVDGIENPGLDADQAEL